MSIQHLINRSIKGLIVVPALPPLNNPPVWDTQPSVFVQAVLGTAVSFDMDDFISDPDSDPLTAIMNTGAAALATGWTWTAATKVLAYDGLGALGTTTGHIITLNDGTDDTASDTFSISIRSTWPVNGWAMQGGYNISDQAKNLNTEPWRTLNGEKDLLIYQSRFQTAGQQAAEVTRLEWFRDNHPGCKMIAYLIPGETKKLTNSGATQHTKDLIEDGTDGSDSWYLKNSSGQQVEAKFDPVRLWKCNEANTVVDNNSLGESYAFAFHKMWYTFHADATNNRINLIDGVYHDVVPPVPQQVRINDGASSSNFDYEDNGSSTSRNGIGVAGGTTLFQAGMGEWQSTFKTRYGSDYAYLANLTRLGLDYDAGDMQIFPVSDNGFYQNWDGGLFEGADGSLNLERTGTGYSNDGGGNPVPRVFLRRLALIHTAVVPLATPNLWGKEFTLVEILLNDRDPLEIDYDAHRLSGGMCALTGQMLGVARNKRTPSEPLDEFVYDWGEPVSGDPSMGTLDLSDASYVVRAADYIDGSNQFHWKEYDNVIWVVKTSPWYPSGTNTYGTGTASNCELPDPGVGMKWIHPDLSAYTHPSNGRSTRAQNNTLNSGSDAASGGSFGVVSLRPAYAAMLARVAV